ncbi:tRNA methyltransferase complex GCD14 subunit-like protein [Elsinoe fawcettii]|nr:tRNA methyltransferase complex GCD14 subunit-like protein [Elsinoe fawcettii]
METVSPFFNAGPAATADSLAVLQMKRDHQLQIILSNSEVPSEGYAEGVVTNTRFGSFPHSTLLNQPWGSQILASKVDTGSRAKGKKRKRDPKDDSEGSSEKPGPVQAAIVAGTGFGHLLQPTPESWTISLPHRTQVVYTPDYSYILQRMSVTPGSHLIEAGAGSGSFTHAAARAVFNQPTSGHVYSYEYHEPRVQSLQEELNSHGLNEIVTVSHRDVYNEGFLLYPTPESPNVSSPLATAIFLDLPAPWLALRNLTRHPLSPATYKALTNPQTSEANPSSNPAPQDAELPSEFTSPLDPNSPVHLCTFTPCIEQVQSVVSSLRQLGWVEIKMVEIANRRMDIRRERVGYAEDGLRGAMGGPKDVLEAVGRLKEVEGRFKVWEGTMKAATPGQDGKSRERDGGVSAEGAEVVENGAKGAKAKGGKGERMTAKQARQERNREMERDRKVFKEGMLVHRTEPDVKAHTSYLVFAVLPVEWSEEDEGKAEEQWSAEEKEKEVVMSSTTNLETSSAFEGITAHQKQTTAEDEADGNRGDQKRQKVDT